MSTNHPPEELELERLRDRAGELERLLEKIGPDGAALAIVYDPEGAMDTERDREPEAPAVDVYGVEVRSLTYAGELEEHPIAGIYAVELLEGPDVAGAYWTRGELEALGRDQRTAYVLELLEEQLDELAAVAPFYELARWSSHAPYDPRHDYGTCSHPACELERLEADSSSADAGAVAAAGAYVEREWPERGYRLRISRSAPRAVLAHVTATDGARFAVVADRYGNAWQVPEQISPTEALAYVSRRARTP